MFQFFYQFSDINYSYPLRLSFVFIISSFKIRHIGHLLLRCCGLCPLRSPLRHGFPCSQGPGIPNTQTAAAACLLMPYHIFISRTHKTVPGRQTPVKPRLITGIYLSCRSYDLINNLSVQTTLQDISGSIGLFSVGIATDFTEKDAFFPAAHTAAATAHPADVLSQNFHQLH